MIEFEIGNLPAAIYFEIWLWLYQNDIGDMRERVLEKENVDVVILTEKEATFVALRWL